ncbi:MAG: HPr-rel-A system PqqD family peptide chaperone [Erythrobacter sp.]|jgi:PqqD family protein of HPr-rel-A system|nr:HPr-rel-A system PqqD family peptide chaperone [Erythrobacter sp.]
MNAPASPAPVAGRISEDVVDCALGDGAAILDLSSGTYFSLGETGAAVWHALKDGADADDIAADLAARYDQPQERVRADVEAFLGQLARAGLIGPGADG